ncbi:hypothetical protein BDR04DRAFT_1105288 [Suillus decipiens]|nr:hypothetical protein BDR04DRAFT_1105288 [Suillus decipiens]
MMLRLINQSSGRAVGWLLSKILSTMSLRRQVNLKNFPTKEFYPFMRIYAIIITVISGSLTFPITFCRTRSNFILPTNI